MLVLIWLSVQLAAAMRSAAAAETCGVAGCHHSFRHGYVAGNWPGVEPLFAAATGTDVARNSGEARRGQQIAAQRACGVRR